VKVIIGGYKGNPASDKGCYQGVPIEHLVPKQLLCLGGSTSLVLPPLPTLVRLHT
jgi:hypothetical protein